MPEEMCQEHLGRCRERVHIWGKINRVDFGASKEPTMLSSSESLGESCKLSGCTIDVASRMQSAVDQVLSKIRLEITAIWRTRDYYTIGELILQSQIHIYELIEISMGAYYHATPGLPQKAKMIIIDSSAT